MRSTMNSSYTQQPLIRPPLLVSEISYGNNAGSYIQQPPYQSCPILNTPSTNYNQPTSFYLPQQPNQLNHLPQIPFAPTDSFLQQSSVASQWNPQQITCQQSYGSTHTYFDSTTCLQPDLSTSIVYSSQSRPSQIRQKNILPIRDPASKEIINLGDEQSSPSSSSNKSSSIDSTLKLPIASKHTSNIPLKFVENTTFSKNIEQECHQESEHSTSILPTTFDNQSLSINSDLSESHILNASENKEQLKDEVDNIQHGEELVATPVKETDIEDGTNLSDSLKLHEQSDIESTTTCEGETSSDVHNDTKETSENNFFIETTYSSNNDIPFESTLSIPNISISSSNFQYTRQKLLALRAHRLSKIRPASLPNIPTIVLAKPNIPINTDSEVNEQVLREVRLILNKITPDTYEKLLKKLESLDICNRVRLEGMINIFFTKAIEDISFCHIYANLCKYFQKKQVTVPDENDIMKTYVFQNLLLQQCQQEFENDYRQEIEYDRRKAEIDQIVNDEIKKKEEIDNLDENLARAKRKKFGNIVFIGELFIVQMLTDSIMYQCIDYLLNEHDDEESLDCLCRLLRSVGETLEIKAKKNSNTKKILLTHYRKLENITRQSNISSRIRFAIQDIMEMRKNGWIARRPQEKPKKIEQIHEEELQRERNEVKKIGHNGHHSQSYKGSHRSQEQLTVKKPELNRSDHRFVVESLRRLQADDKQYQGSTSLKFAPMGGLKKWSTVEKKTVKNDQSITNRHNTSSPSSPQSPKTNRFYQLHSMSNNSPIEKNVSEDYRRNSSINSNTSLSSDEIENKKTILLDEEKILERVRSLVKEYTENYSTQSDVPIRDAIDDFIDFCTSNVKEQALIVQELMTNVLESKALARVAIGRLLDAVIHKKILSNEGFLSGFQSVVDLAPDLAIDIPHIWQYIGEIIGSFLIGTSSSSHIDLLTAIFQKIPDTKSKQMFEYIIRYAVEFSSKEHVRKLWQSSTLTFEKILKVDLIDSAFVHEFEWLINSSSAQPDLELVKLFKNINNQDSDIVAYINHHLNSSEKFFIRTIVFSYLESCLMIGQNQEKRIQEDIARSHIGVLKAFINNSSDIEIQIIYAIQHFVYQFDHPPKMAAFFFDLFYEEDCVSEDSFFQWCESPDPLEIEGHTNIVNSTTNFFTWLKETDEQETSS
ncbi:unnamed protein product [Rotaria sordida]|uniref:Uncharacterized protein n=1 Tax=Rotaria sordida TaxID=392033 RepID=A0A815FK51_9BILA|nr:unnamed protein product [Rotaria sordida]CAF1589080.1 unnamed protein product [Rotaria sordida]